MAVILLVEDAPDLALYEGILLRTAGHHVISCTGGPSPFAACTMLRYGACSLPDSADAIIFGCTPVGPLRHRTYRAIHLLRAYRAHARYGRLPMLLVGAAIPSHLPGAGPIESIPKFSEPRDLVDAVERLLTPAHPLAATT